MGIRPARSAALILAAISVAILMASPFVNASPQAGYGQGASEALAVSVAPLQHVYVAFAPGSNVSVVSVTGGTYQLTESNANLTNNVQFEPMDYSVYQLVLSSLSSGANYASVSVQGASSDAEASNFSAYGEITLSLTVNSTSAAQPSVGASQPGTATTFLGFTQTGLEVLGAIAVVTGAYLFVLATRYRAELSLAGLVLLVVGGMEILGILLALEALAAYVAGFAAISIAWRVHVRRMG